MIPVASLFKKRIAMRKLLQSILVVFLEESGGSLKELTLYDHSDHYSIGFYGIEQL